MNSYYQGDLIPVTNTPGFAVNGAPTDPTTVTLRVGQLSQTTKVNATYPASPVTKTSTGLYAANLDTATWVPGVYWYRWIGTGTVQVTNQGLFLLLPVSV